MLVNYSISSSEFPLRFEGMDAVYIQSTQLYSFLIQYRFIILKCTYFVLEEYCVNQCKSCI